MKYFAGFCQIQWDSQVLCIASNPLCHGSLRTSLPSNGRQLLLMTKVCQFIPPAHAEPENMSLIING
jgi:hypothetical protein